MVFIIPLEISIFFSPNIFSLVSPCPPGCYPIYNWCGIYGCWLFPGIDHLHCGEFAFALHLPLKTLHNQLWSWFWATKRFRGTPPSLSLRLLECRLPVEGLGLSCVFWNSCPCSRPLFRWRRYHLAPAQLNLVFFLTSDILNSDVILLMPSDQGM